MFIRLPAWLASVATVIFAARAGERWGGQWTGFWLAAWAALNPVWVLYAGEARPYALGILAVMAWWAATASDLDDRDPPLAVLLTVTTIATTHAAAVFVCAATALRWAESRTRARAAVVVATWAAAGLSAWWFVVPQRAHQAADLGAGFLAPQLATPATALPWLVRTVPELALYTLTSVKAERWLLVGVLAIVALIGLMWRTRPPASLVRLSLIPVALFAALGAAGLHPFGGVRQVLVLTPGLALLVAWCVPRLPARQAGLATLGVFAISVTALEARPGLPHEDLPSVLEGIEDRDRHAPRIVDAGAAPVVALLAPREDDVAVPWLAGEPLTSWLDANLPTDRARWLVVTRSRERAANEISRHLEHRGWRAGATATAPGAHAVLWAPPGYRPPARRY